MKIKSRLKEELKKYLAQKTQEEQEKVSIISAYKLTDEDKNQIYSILPQIKQKSVNYLVDENLLGGIVVKQGSKIVDLSLQTRLKSLANILNETT